MACAAPHPPQPAALRSREGGQRRRRFPVQLDLDQARLTAIAHRQVGGRDIAREDVDATVLAQAAGNARLGWIVPSALADAHGALNDVVGHHGAGQYLAALVEY